MSSLLFFAATFVQFFIPGCLSVSRFIVCVSLALCHLAIFNYKSLTWKFSYLELFITCIYPEIESCFFYQKVYWTQYEKAKIPKNKTSCFFPTNTGVRTCISFFFQIVVSHYLYATIFPNGKYCSCIMFSCCLVMTHHTHTQHYPLHLKGQL